MSGRKQHHIPQSFLRGFLYCEKSGQVCVYRYGGTSHISSTKDVAAQRDFYSKPTSDGNQGLDDKITEYEYRLDFLLRTLRSIEIGAEASASIAAEVIAHLTPRGKNVRRMFVNFPTRLIAGFSEILSDEEAFAHLLGLGEPAPNETWNKQVVASIDGEPRLTQAIEFILAQTKMPKSLLDRVFFMWTKEHILGGTNPIPEQFQQAFSTYLSRIDTVASENHKKMLNTGLIAEPRKQFLEELIWHVRPAPSEGAIMPDCIALGFDEDEGGFLPYIMTSMVTSVVMPLTSEKLLVGVRAGCLAPNLSIFNREASECSDELFIASTANHVNLGQNIGKRWKDKMDSLVQDAFESLKSYQSYKNTEPVAAVPAPFSPYQLAFIGWLIEEDIAPVRETTQAIVEKLRQRLDLKRLDGITFTSEFGQTLTETERSFDTDTTQEGGPDHIAQGASAILVMRDGELKVRIVLNKAYALSLVGEDLQDASVALHLIVSGLSLTHTVNQFENMLPGFFLEPVSMDDYDAVLHCALRKALRAYRYAYDSAEFGAEDLFEQEFSNYLVSALDLAYSHIVEAKTTHTVDGDHQKLFHTVHSAATDVLIESAKLIGHLHGTGKPALPAPETALGAAIMARELAGWFNTFAYDLQRFWQKETWTREDLYALNIHVERLLWPCRIFLYPADDGQGMIMSL
jgi:hypothetical protein